MGRGFGSRRPAAGRQRRPVPERRDRRQRRRDRPTRQRRHRR
ncbi:MAG: hypothetical protein M3Y52_03660 [Actinomycetota bacterium]|nr:hypothetical protein [Actinomycetota bacterium]